MPSLKRTASHFDATQKDIRQIVVFIRQRLRSSTTASKSSKCFNAFRRIASEGILYAIIIIVIVKVIFGATVLLQRWLVTHHS